MKYDKNGITLIALIITIIILLILAGISIAGLTSSGLFEKAKQAKNDSENAQDLENTTLADYENNIDKITIGSNRENSSAIIKNLLDEEKIYNAKTSWTVINDTITLNDSIENYDEIVFRYISKANDESSYIRGTEKTYLTKTIQYCNDLPNVPDGKQISLEYNFIVGGNTAYMYGVYCAFGDNNKFFVGSTATTWSKIEKIKITGIYGVKY